MHSTRPQLSCRMFVRTWMHVLVVLSVGTIAPADAAESLALTLRDAVELALGANYDLTIERLSPEAAGASLDAAKAGYVPDVTVSAETGRSESPLSTSTATGLTTSVDATQSSVAAGVSGLLPTGASYSLTTGISRNDTDRTVLDGSTGGFTGTSITTAQSQVSVAELRQPLLRGRRIDATRLAIAQSRLDLDAAELSLLDAANSTVSAVEQAYYDLIAARETVMVYQAALDLAKQTLADTLARIGVGTLPPLDEKEAQSLVASSEADLLAIRQSLREQTNALKLLIAEDFSAWRETELVPADRLALATAELDFNTSADLALARRPDLRQLGLTVDQQKLSVRHAREQRLPQLDAIASVGLSGASDSVSGSWSQVRNADNPSYAVGLALSLPWSDRKARGTTRAAEVFVRQAELRLAQARQTVLSQIDAAIFAVQTDYERVLATRQAREFAEAALDAERAKLAQGATTTFVVLQLQRNLTAARADEIDAVASYNKSLSTLRLREGTALDRWSQLTTDLAPSGNTSS